MSHNNPRPPVFFIVGPTAVGKSAAALELAAEHSGEIISADSMQVYRMMDIGTAKPSPADRQRVPHHLIDIVDPDEPWSVAEFASRARPLLSEITARGRVPIVCGGTGLYIRALLEGYQFPPQDLTGNIRRELRNEAERSGAASVHAQLAAADPISAARISTGDLKRMIRALEVFRITGRPISGFDERSPLAGEFDVTVIGLDRPREELNKRINERVSAMVRGGLVDEVRSILQRGFSKDLAALQALGYKETIRFLETHGTPEDLEAEIQQKTRNFGKRQMTWWRSLSSVRWVAPDKFLCQIDQLGHFDTNRAS